MLVLARKPNEEIIITVAGKEIKVVVLKERTNGRVNIGIEADIDVEIFRKEVYDKRKQG